MQANCKSLSTNKYIAYYMQDASYQRFQFEPGAIDTLNRSQGFPANKPVKQFPRLIRTQSYRLVEQTLKRNV